MDGGRPVVTVGFEGERKLEEPLRQLSSTCIVRCHTWRRISEVRFVSAGAGGAGRQPQRGARAAGGSGDASREVPLLAHTARRRAAPGACASWWTGEWPRSLRGFFL